MESTSNTSKSSADADVARRSDLREQLKELTEVEALSKSSFLLKLPPALESAGDPSAEEASRKRKAVVQLEVVKPALSASEPQPLLDMVRRSLDEETVGAWFANDRYNKKTMVGGADVVVEVVSPADGRDINKRRAVSLQRKMETAELYETVTKPKLVETAAKRDQWVANVIEGKKEQESLVPELACESSLVLKDYKWQDVSNTANLYYLVLFKDMTVRSIRDLRGEKHLATLRRIQQEVIPGLAAKHSVPAEQLIAYVHYHPSFWYFHIHVVNTKHAMFSGDGSENLFLSAMERFHKLETIIALLEAKADYYEKASLSVLLLPYQLPWYEATQK
mmetsp:Transcript_81728/g.179606  ORF Transcript_81728/g.179606 Transcript_81728/m.179606 type:complete len:335 (+) Transcript_81728:70-1074(+)